MRQVGASGGAFDFVPTSSSTSTKAYSQLAALAETLPSSNRSMMKLPVLPYQAWPGAVPREARNAGQVHFIVPSACCCISPSTMRGFCRTMSAVSPCGAS